jgi:hypothetical protein
MKNYHPIAFIFPNSCYLCPIICNFDANEFCTSDTFCRQPGVDNYPCLWMAAQVVLQAFGL